MNDLVNLQIMLSECIKSQAATPVIQMPPIVTSQLSQETMRKKSVILSKPAPLVPNPSTSSHRRELNKVQSTSMQEVAPAKSEADDQQRKGDEDSKMDKASQHLLSVLRRGSQSKAPLPILNRGGSFKLSDKMSDKAI